jgi:peptidyl-prolyl cis-trans isomerase C
MIVFEELVYQEAQRRNMTVPAARIDRAEAEFHKQFSSREEFDQYLKSEMKGSRQVLRQTIRRSLLIEALLKAEVNAKSNVTEAEIKAYYEKNGQRFEHGESFSIQTISILPPENASPEIKNEARRRAENALRQAKSTKSYQEFGLLAEKISEDDFRVNMGDHHDVERDKLPPEIVKAALAMQPGQVSDLIQLGGAYSLFRLNAHTPAGKAPFPDVRKQLQTDLQKQKSEQLRAGLNQKLRKNANIETL